MKTIEKGKCATVKQKLVLASEDLLLKTESTSITVNRVSKKQLLALKKKEKFDAQFTLASMHMWNGVKLYYGDSKWYVGKIICFNRSYQHPILRDIKFNGVKVYLHRSKTKEWKRRKYVRDWYVRKDDSAIKAQRYTECKY